MSGKAGNSLHAVSFGNAKIEFRLRRSKRKTLGITVEPDMSISVNAPITADMEAVERNRKNFADEPRMRVEHSEFAGLARFCAPESLSGALFDLGVSSRQLDSL